MNSIFEMFIKSWILRVSCKVTSGFTLTLQEIQSIHDSMNSTKIECIAYILHFYYKYLQYKKRIILEIKQFSINVSSY